jgi:hypothetical protein
MKTIRILILEDDLKTLSVIMDKLFSLEEEMAEKGILKEIAVTVLSEFTQVLDYPNSSKKVNFNIVLLDYDCKACGSFHVLDFKKFDPTKIIAISTNKEYNDAATEKGVSRVVRKDYRDLTPFADLLVEQIKELMGKID